MRSQGKTAHFFSDGYREYKAYKKYVQTCVLGASGVNVLAKLINATIPGDLIEKQGVMNALFPASNVEETYRTHQRTNSPQYLLNKALEHPKHQPNDQDST